MTRIAKQNDAATQEGAMPIAEMSRLHAAGHSLIPLGGGDDGKSPLARFAGKARLPISTVIKRMQAAGSAMYGVRMSGLLVIDADTDNDATRTYVEDRFGMSPVTTRTPRGRHWYFRHDGAAAKVVRDDKSRIAIDFKSGANAYVAGPGSIRPDGGVYDADGAPLGSVADLPAFIDLNPDRTDVARNADGQVAVGGRTFALWDHARELVECIDSEAALVAEMRAYADWHFEEAHTFTDAEIEKAAAWAWGKRLSNELWGGGKSAVKIYAHEIERLQAFRNCGDALMLLSVLRHNHEGRDRKGKPFTIATRAMADADTIKGWAASRYHRAKEALETAGLIRPVFKGFAKRLPDGTVTGSKPSEYLFATPLEHDLGGGVSSYIHFTGETSVKGRSANAA